jgi:hypothetical protein
MNSKPVRLQVNNGFIDHIPEEKNPLKDFKRAQHSTKTHGNVYSYAANTH